VICWREITLAGLLLASVASVSASEPVQDPRVQLVADPAVLADFELTDQDNHKFHLSQLRGREALFFFGFTHCASICPTALFELKLVSEALEKSGQKAPAVVFVSVDGERDTPETMKNYLAAFPESFIGVTGDPKSVRKIAAEFKAVFFKGLPYDNAGNYQVEHTSLIYFVDSGGRLRASFLDAPVESMAASIGHLSSRGP
jgi:protein SCO1/2